MVCDYNRLASESKFYRIRSWKEAKTIRNDDQKKFKMAYSAIHPTLSLCATLIIIRGEGYQLEVPIVVVDGTRQMGV